MTAELPRRPARVVMVAAVAENGVIGHDGEIPWRIPADFAHFKRVTIGHPLVLGRTTFEGIGRPLPGRQSIVLTRDPGWRREDVIAVPGIDEALVAAADLDDLVSIGGGAQVYEAAMRWATHQILTRVHLTPRGTSRYPSFEEGEWRETAHEPHLDGDPAWEIRWLERQRGS